MDGKLIHLPDLEGVVVLNIPSWGGGCQPWGTETENGRFTVPRLVKLLAHTKLLELKNSLDNRTLKNAVKHGVVGV